MSDKQEISKVAKRRTKLVYEAFQEEPDDREMLFQTAAMCHVFFPRREPDLQPHETWEQRWVVANIPGKCFIRQWYCSEFKHLSGQDRRVELL